jgi:hypothetical protein
MSPSLLTNAEYYRNFVLFYTIVEGKNYSQKSCCNSDSETTCSAPLIDESQPPTTARPSELSPVPTPPSRSELYELIGIIAAVVGAAAAVVTIFVVRREPNPAREINLNPLDEDAI